MKNEPTILREEKDDLKIFISIFEPSKYKTLKNGIEIRGQTELERNVTSAKALIRKFKLNLVVNTNAQMASYRAFEVNKI